MTGANTAAKSVTELKQDHVAVLGCGVIGLSWAMALLSKGYSVRVWDPDPEIENKLEPLRLQFPRSSLSIHDSPEQAVTGARFVQESGPESLDIKKALYTHMASVIGPDCIVASSTSTLPPSQLQKGSAFADRIVIGHPFNPPHLLPLVEVVGGSQTSSQTIERAMAFYRSIGKQPIHLRTERPGHLANRLQAAVWREAIDAVASGQCTVADVDIAMTAALGPRWAVMGPFKTFQLGGGVGGLEHFFEHLGDAFEALWDDAKRPQVTDKLKQQLITEAQQLTVGRSYSELTGERDKQLQAVLNARLPEDKTQ